MPACEGAKGEGRLEGGYSCARDQDPDRSSVHGCSLDFAAMSCIRGRPERVRGFPEASISQVPDWDRKISRDAWSMKTKTLIVGVDGSDGSRAAVDEAIG